MQIIHDPAKEDLSNTNIYSSSKLQYYYYHYSPQYGVHEYFRNSKSMRNWGQRN